MSCGSASSGRKHERSGWTKGRSRDRFPRGTLTTAALPATRSAAALPNTLRFDFVRANDRRLLCHLLRRIQVLVLLDSTQVVTGEPARSQVRVEVAERAFEARTAIRRAAVVQEAVSPPRVQARRAFEEGLDGSPSLPRPTDLFRLIAGGEPTECQNARECEQWHLAQKQHRPILPL